MIEILGRAGASSLTWPVSALGWLGGWAQPHSRLEPPVWPLNVACAFRNMAEVFSERASPEEASGEPVFQECQGKSVRPFLPELWKSHRHILPNSVGYGVKARGPVQLRGGRGCWLWWWG